MQAAASRREICKPFIYNSLLRSTNFGQKFGNLFLTTPLREPAAFWYPGQVAELGI
jgi:hypothetical protein